MLQVNKFNSQYDDYCDTKLKLLSATNVYVCFNFINYTYFAT